MSNGPASPYPANGLPSLRPARLDDYPQIEALEASHGLLTLSTRDWQRLWVDNPVRLRVGESWPIGWVLEDGASRVVGSLGNIPTSYVFAGNTLIAATGRAWVVAPEYRGVALWLMDEYFQQDAADLFINTTVNALAVDAFSAFGSARVPLGDWETASYWITGYRGFARTALRIKQAPLSGLLAYPAAAALRLKDAYTVRSLPASGEIAESADFDSRFDPFWEALVRQNSDVLLALRDRQTLSWHFGAALRAGHAWIFTASRNGLLRAYGVVKRQDHPPSGLIRMRLADYQSLDPDVDWLPSLIQAALVRCTAEGIYVLEYIGANLPKTHSLDSLAPYRRKLAAWPYYYKAGDPALDARLRDGRAWDPSAYDGDASL